MHRCGSSGVVCHPAVSLYGITYRGINCSMQSAPEHLFPPHQMSLWNRDILLNLMTQKRNHYCNDLKIATLYRDKSVIFQTRTISYYQAHPPRLSDRVPVPDSNVCLFFFYVATLVCMLAADKGYVDSPLG